MNVQMREDFIGVFEKAFDKKECERMITYFEKNLAAGRGMDRQFLQKVSPLMMDDWAIAMQPNHYTTDEIVADIRPVSDRIAELVKMYSNTFAMVNGFGDQQRPVMIQDMKVQRTSPGQGYHVWHCEHGGERALRRVLAFSVFLNDVEEGGETEFLYQKCRFYPEQGDCLIWPAQFTHTHRGNQPISNDKYILTGWVEKQF